MASDKAVRDNAAAMKRISERGKTVQFAAVRIDSDVKAAIAKNGVFGESINDVLRRVLSLPPHGDKRQKK